MNRVAFVVLHYLTLKDTIDCVESVLNNIKYENFYVIIVDNGSPNNSGKTLHEKYKNHKKVFVVLLGENIGFANGNNYGFKIAKYIFNSNFIIFINNDTLLLQDDFLDKIIEIYTYTNFYVLGPDIISIVDGSHQNPLRLTGFTKIELILWILNVSFLLLLNYLKIESITRRIKRGVFKEKKKNMIPYNIEQINVLLHGSCLIFSPKFVEKLEGLCTKTFMYMEEDILYYQMKSLGLISLYSPDVKIFHKEDVSTDAIFNDQNKKNRFKYKHLIASSMLLLRMMMKKE